MKRTFLVKVKFNLTEDVKNCINVDFDPIDFSEDGILDYIYVGNTKSGKEAVEKGTKHYFNHWRAFKGNFTILSIEEVTVSRDGNAF